jgi:DNA-binding transcriptional ArsR family regulator
MSSRKKDLHVLIDIELYKMLVTLAPSITNQSKYRGAISQIVEEALRLYFSKHTPPRGDTLPPSTHTQSTNSAKSRLTSLTMENKVHRAFIRVLDVIRRLHNYPENEVICEIIESDLITAIRQVIGVDPRTIRKWLIAFQDHKLIKYDRGVSPRIFYKVLVYPICLE